jgi:hypothetical protein
MVPGVVVALDLRFSRAAAGVEVDETLNLSSGDQTDG